MYKTEQDIINVYTIIISGDREARIAIHDDIIENTSILFQYYLMKAFSFEDWDTYISFAADTGYASQPKQIFHNILTMYENTYNSMNYRHPVEEALPKVAEFQKLYQLAR